MPLSLAHGEDIFKLIQYERACCAYEHFSKTKETINKKVNVAGL
jgi:hypothetical protein